MRSALLACVLLVLACRDKVDREKLAKATALAGAPPVEPGCPAGADIMGAPRPRGSGQWCQRFEAGRLRVYRLDGTLWAEGAAREATGMEGPWMFYAPDGKTVALVRTYDKNVGTNDDVKVEGVELPPTIAPVCYAGWDGTKPATTTKCPPQ